MAKTLFPKGIIKIIDEDGEEHLAEYMGRQKWFECKICDKGRNCYTFNIFDSVEEYNKGGYETWGYGREHINLIKLAEQQCLTYEKTKDGWVLAAALTKV